MVVAPTVIAVAALAGLCLAASVLSFPADVLEGGINTYDKTLKRIITHNKVNASLCQLDDIITVSPTKTDQTRTHIVDSVVLSLVFLPSNAHRNN